MDDRAVQRFLAELIGRPMRYGIDDCLLSAADLSMLLTGCDPIATIRGRWIDRSSALEFERGLAGGTRREKAQALAQMLGLMALEPATAPCGALGLVAGERREVAACRFIGGWFARSASGFSVQQKAVLAWSFASF